MLIDVTVRVSMIDLVAIYGKRHVGHRSYRGHVEIYTGASPFTYCGGDGVLSCDVSDCDALLKATKRASLFVAIASQYGLRCNVTGYDDKLSSGLFRFIIETYEFKELSTLISSVPLFDPGTLVNPYDGVDSKLCRLLYAYQAEKAEKKRISDAVDEWLDVMKNVGV